MVTARYASRRDVAVAAEASSSPATRCAKPGALGARWALCQELRAAPDSGTSRWTAWTRTIGEPSVHRLASSVPQPATRWSLLAESDRPMPGNLTRATAVYVRS
jgi:hypothetical protein